LNKSEFETFVEQSLLEVQRLIREQDRFSEVFRNRYEHTLRVLSWAGRIQKVEGGDLEVITLAVLFHDVGWSEVVNHAQVSADLALKYLQDKQVDHLILDRIVSAVRTHNLREISISELPIENRIVMDADLLDELGVTALVWDAFKTAVEEIPGYKKVLEVTQKNFQVALKERASLKTETGLKMYDDRLKTWNLVIENLGYELGVIERTSG
jgi:HD superfamily phosphodiesterase